ncbi:TP53-binding protein 1-like [Paramacrobiotus metropolitanus]|uniref:TP53-binding protein 1-like n=1 Tax=Paramacrobiotus metropolitanus TaxID=2943436 RepID=UPI00244610DF|nr:TP53-binding protein 1-like [Paramacrobiotus metropolitanus]XP_055340684.1 TP53-binding protein 1-like [Paramacrobiotus metropolitanus]XP_055340693.1 TP53-binding protein 1-like [Paramacrobiotus metropolitanus]XP_055340700.1 TP53-binding protein 1-like [Paramacrobiotus metropolitanus]
MEEPMPETAQAAQHADDNALRIGDSEYQKGELVFGLFKDSKFLEDRWYLARVLGVDADKKNFEVEWFEDKKAEILPPNYVMKQKDMIQPGLDVNILRQGKTLYDVVTVTEFREDGKHVFKNRRGTVVKNHPPIESIMVKVPDLEEFRNFKDQKRRMPVSETDQAVAGTADGNKPSAARPKKLLKAASRPESAKSVDTEKLANGSGSSTSSPRTSLHGTASEAKTGFLSGWNFIFSEGSAKDGSFSRSKLTAEIESVGGKVWSTFSELSKSAGNKMLLAPTYSRTAKYFQCLAANIPCISHRWIDELMAENKFSLFQSFRLPAGRSTSGAGAVVEWKPRSHGLLKGRRLGFFSVNSIESVWRPIVRAAGAECVVLEFHNFLSGTLLDDTGLGKLQLHVIMHEEQCPTELVDAARNCNVPLCDTEWLLETLIQGTIQPCA